MPSVSASLTDLPAAETARLKLARLEVEDADSVRTLTDDPAITSAVHFLPEPFRMEDATALIAGDGAGADRFIGVRRKTDDCLVAVLGVHLRGEDGIEIGYWVGSIFQRQGYAHEAALGLIQLLRRSFPSRSIVAECSRGNTASWRLLQKLGFRATRMAGRRPGRDLLIFQG